MKTKTDGRPSPSNPVRQTGARWIHTLLVAGWALVPTLVPAQSTLDWDVNPWDWDQDIAVDANTVQKVFTNVDASGVDVTFDVDAVFGATDTTSSGDPDRDSLYDWLHESDDDGVGGTVQARSGANDLFGLANGPTDTNSLNFVYGEADEDDCISITIGFSKPVTDVSFFVYDVDKSSWVGALGSEDSTGTVGLGWLDQVTITGSGGVSPTLSLDPVYGSATASDPANIYDGFADAVDYISLSGNTATGRWQSTEKKSVTKSGEPETESWKTEAVYGAEISTVSVSFAEPITELTIKHENLWSDPSNTTRNPTTEYWAGHSNDFGISDLSFTPPARVGDLVWSDDNNNGIFDSGTESGIDGVKVQLFRAGDDPATATPVAETTTSGGGLYEFDANPGDYFIYIPPSEFGGGGSLEGLITSSGNDPAPDPDANADGTDTGTDHASGGVITADFDVVGGEQELTVDFGFTVPNSIGDLVWVDTDGDGAQDGGETGLTGVTVNLLDGNGDPVLDSGGMAVTTTTSDGTTDVDGDGSIDPAGSYYFGGLLDGDYIVEFAAPGGYTASPQDSAGASEATDSDADPATGRTGVISLSGGTYNEAVDAGFYQAASLSDFVWSDLNADGVQNGGEPGLDGVTVRLLDPNNGFAEVATTTTAGGGFYSFTDLVAGDYVVEFVAPVDYVASPQNLGGDDALDSDAGIANGRTGTISLAAGEDNDTVDAGFYQPASISDLVWDDLDGDGIQDGGEAGIDGVTVRLLDPNNGYSVITTTTTSGGGMYSFDGLAPGDYVVEFVPPGGYTPTAAGQGDGTNDSDPSPATGRTGTLTLTAGQDNVDIDAGYYQPATIGNVVWNDLNGDGIQDGGAEAGIEGITVNLLDATGTVILATTTTDSNGSYSFGNLAPGDYMVEFGLPNGFIFSPQGTGTASDSDAGVADGRTGIISVSSGETNSTIDAGIYLPGSISDFVWHDLDADGVQEIGEPGIEGVTVRLLDADNGLVELATTTTDANGLYSFGDLGAGNYVVEFVSPGATWDGSPAGSGTDGNFDSDADPGTGQSAPIALGVGEDLVNVDAGFYQPAIISNFVWNDLDGDGVQGAGEPGLEGVTVNLIKGGVQIGTTTTDANGFYYFDMLAPGSDYVVEFVSPGAGWDPSPQDDPAATDATDSDADQTTGRTGTITLGSGDAIDTIDAGFYLPPNISNFVWEDYDNDGIQDPGEPGLENVTVNLLDPVTFAVVQTTTTNASGLYVLEGFAPGTYLVEFIKPAGYESVTQGAGTDDTVDSDASATDGRTGTYTLNPGDMIDTVDAGFFAPATISDLVWDDLDGDGMQDAGEPGIDGVEVRLYAAGDLSTVIGTVFTSGGGLYEFDGLVAGDYVVEFVTPTGYDTVAQDAGVDDTVDSDYDPGTGQTATIPLASGETQSDIDAGFYKPSSISDFVWNDLDGDGVQGGSEPGIDGVTVNLLDPDNGFAVIATTTTSGGGAYSFDGLGEGNYVVEFVTPGGYVTTSPDQGGDDALDSDASTTTGRTGTIALAADTDLTDIDAGFYQPSSISDRVWNDLNGDGVQDAAETEGIGGVTINLLDPDNGYAVIATTTSDATGAYSFDDLPAGSYVVEFITPGGYTASPQSQGGDGTADSDASTTDGRTAPINLGSGENVTDVDAGFFDPATISDFVWNDLNGDGIQDPGEPGLDGVTVNLLDATGTVILATTTTSGGGAYSFGNLGAGEYVVEFVIPTDYTASPQGAGGDPALDSDADTGTGRTAAVTVTPGETVEDIDAGLYQPVSISGAVLADTDNNGSGDSGIESVTLALLDGNGDPVDDPNQPGFQAYEVQTAADGSYLFDNLPPGTYQVSETQPAGYDSLSDTDGGDLDVIGDVTPIVLTSGQTSTGNDFVEEEPGSLSGFVLVDTDGNGTGDTGIESVTLTLMDASGNPVDGDPDTPGVQLVTTTTAMDGSYSFGGLPPGDYQVAETQPSGYDSLSDSDGGYFNVVGDVTVITVTAGADTPANDFVETVSTGVIGNYLWLDEDGDGVQDAGESGIPDVDVILRDGGGAIIATTTTDANGGYLFTDLPPGDYTVEVDGTGLPTGLNLTKDPDATADGQHGVTLGEGEEYLTADFGYNFVPSGDSSSPGSGATGAIGDTVWNDADGDGVQDPGESGIEGVTVSLLTDDNGDGIYGGAGDNPPATTTTDASGNYFFDEVTPGSYVVEVTPPTGYTQTGDPDGILDDATSFPVVVAPGDVITIADFGYNLVSGGAAIGDTIYLDANGNGAHDPATDPGIAGVTVALLDAAGTVMATTTTDGNGNYSFPGLPTGVDYTVVVTDTDNVLGDLVQTGDPDGGNDGQSTVTGFAADDPDQDFGYAPIGHSIGDGLIGDTVFLDLDGDDSPDAGEGVEGVTVELYDATGTVLLSTTTTDENGNYSFGGLDPVGTYTVKVDPTGTILAGVDNSVDPDGGTAGEAVVDLAASGGTALDQDFGYVPVAGPNTISGTIWDDSNADGTLDESGNGIEGVTVVLRDSNGNVVATTTTDLNGNYSFGNVPDGTYTVDVTDDANVLNGYWHSESVDQVSDGTSKTDPYSVTVSGGATDSTGDFGYYQDPAVLGDFVFDDLNGDGIQDGDEPGIPGVVVTLTIVYPVTGDTVVATTTTAADGSYNFIGLLDESYSGSGGAGEPTYTVTVATPDRYLPSPSNVGTDDAADSDDGVAGEPAELVQGGVDPSNDFGFVKQKATNYSDFITDAGLDPAAVDGSGQPLPDGSGTGGNPDGDWSSNLLEHAFCDDPTTGVPNHQGFCVELANAATGQMDASFIRAEGIEDVIYTLQGADSMLGPWFTIDTIAAGAAAGGGFVATSNGDGTETVTYANVQNDAGYADHNFGFARLCVSLDSEPDGTPDTIVLPSDGSSVEATDYTKMFGWQCVDYNVAECASFSHPFTNKPAFSGTVDGNTAASATVDATASAGGVDLATLNLGPIDLDPGAGVQLVATHYLQVTSGALEGERFDIASASGGVLTLVDDPDIFAAGDGVRSLNTSSGVPADDILLGATFQVLPHKTIDQLFDKNGAFAGLQSVSDETRLLFYESRVESPGFATLSLANTGSGVKWVYLGDSNSIDQGLRPVDRTTGSYIHSTVGGTTVCGVGLVADHDLAHAFNEGYNLAGAPYPISQTAEGLDGRAMSVGSAAEEFLGAGTPSQSTELFLWMGDGAVDALPAVVPYIEGYERFMAADDGGTFQQWVNPSDPTLADLGSDPGGPLLVPGWRALTVKMVEGETLEPHLYPLPGSP